MNAVKSRTRGAARRDVAPAHLNGSEQPSNHVDPFQARPSSHTPLRPRRRPKLIAVGVLAICVGGLGAAALYNAAVSEQQVIMVSRDLPRGQTVGADDLAVIELGTPPGVSVVTAAELDGLIGQTALRELAAGSVLPAGAIGEDPLPEGKSAVGLRLPAGRLPVGALTPGVPVSLVPVQPINGERDEGIAGLAPVSATLASIPTLAPDQSAWLVDVHVATVDARTVTELAATDRLAMVLEAGG